MSSSKENDGQAYATEDHWMSHSAGYDMRENEPALDFEHLDSASDVQALLCELEAGLGITTEVEDSSLPLVVDRRMDPIKPLSEPAVSLGCAIQEWNATDAAPIPQGGTSEFTLKSSSAGRKEVIDLTGEEDDERVTQASVRQTLRRKRDLGNSTVQPRRPSLPFSPSLAANYQIPQRSLLKSAPGAALSRLSVPVHGGGFALSPLLPDPAAIPMDTLWDFSTSQPPGPLYPATMPELMAPQPRRHLQDFQISDSMVAAPVGLGITMDATSLGPDGGFGALPPTNMLPSTYCAPWSTIDPLTTGIAGGPELALGSSLVELPSVDVATWEQPLSEPRISNADPLLATAGPSLRPTFSLRPATPISSADARPGPTSNLSPKKQMRTSTSSWPDLVMAHYNPRSYSNPPILHGSPIKVKQSNGPIRGADLKIVSTRYPFPTRGEAKLPKTPEKKRKATSPCAPTTKATPSPARPPNIGQSWKVVQAFAAQKAERNEERTRNGTIGPASLNKEKAGRKREKNGGKLGDHEVENNGAKDPKLNESGLPAGSVANVPDVEWAIFGGVGAEKPSGVPVGVPAGALQTVTPDEEASSGLTLPPTDDWVSAFLGVGGTSGPASLPSSQPFFDYPFTFDPPNSCAPAVSLPNQLGGFDPGLWFGDFAEPWGSFLPGGIPEPTLADRGEGNLWAGQKRTLDVHNDEDAVDRAAKRVRI